MKTSLKLFIIFLFLFIFMGCAKLLPSSQSTVISPWKDFDNAKLEYEKIIPGKTTLADLKKLRFDPYEVSNIRIMNVTEIIGLFLPNPSIKKEDLDVGIQKCIENRHRCKAYLIEPNVLIKMRVGNFWSDIFTFKQSTIYTGWEFRGLITIVDDVVTYRNPAGGRPLIKSEEVIKKPLGLLQDIGSFIATEAPKVW
ncbi:MAG: hypothetical protein HQK77_05380 [Desulfobacterales bacterium]|nr:hypothetical protein [Desulfobacterales bacterium]